MLQKGSRSLDINGTLKRSYGVNMYNLESIKSILIDYIGILYTKLNEGLVNIDTIALHNLPLELRQCLDNIHNATSFMQLIDELVTLERHVIGIINERLALISQALDPGLSFIEQRGAFQLIMELDRCLAGCHSIIASNLEDGLARTDMRSNENLSLIQQVTSHIIATDRDELLLKQAILLALVKGLFYHPIIEGGDRITPFMKLLHRLADNMVNREFKINLRIMTEINKVSWQVGLGQKKTENHKPPLDKTTAKDFEYWETARAEAEKKGALFPTTQKLLKMHFSQPLEQYNNCYIDLIIPRSEINSDAVNVKVLKHALFSSALLVNRGGVFKFFPQQLIVLHELAHLCNLAEGKYLYASENHADMPMEWVMEWENFEEFWVTIGSPSTSEFRQATVMGIEPRIPYKLPVFFLAALAYNFDVTEIMRFPLLAPVYDLLVVETYNYYPVDLLFGIARGNLNLDALGNARDRLLAAATSAHLTIMP